MRQLRYSLLLLFLMHVGSKYQVAAQVAMIGNNCTTEPWGRYSASGGLYQTTENGTVRSYLYSFGGDTSTIADSSGGGVVRTNFRFNLLARCWERLADSPVAIGYRATAILLQEDSFYVFGGSNAQFQALNHMYRYSIRDNTWTDVTAAAAPDGPSARWRHTAVKLSDTTMLIHGGRQGSTVLSDAWIYDAELSQWMMVSADIGVAAYRHGMAYDSQRDVVWIHGGIDADFARHARLYRWDRGSSSRAMEVLGGTTMRDEKPTRRASHVMQYVQELDSLVLYGGTCGDQGQAYLYNISTGQWCSIEAEQQPSLRDAMLWAVQYPNFYIYGGDLICIEVGQVYSIADVHVLDLTASSTWENIYVPYNQRASDLTELCDGTNAGSCRAPPLLGDASMSDWSSVCRRSDFNPTSGVSESGTTPTLSPGVSTLAPTSGIITANHWQGCIGLLVSVSAWLLASSVSWT